MKCIVCNAFVTWQTLPDSGMARSTFFHTAKTFWRYVTYDTVGIRVQDASSSLAESCWLPKNLMEVYLALVPTRWVIFVGFKPHMSCPFEIKDDIDKYQPLVPPVMAAGLLVCAHSVFFHGALLGV